MAARILGKGEGLEENLVRWLEARKGLLKWDLSEKTSAEEEERY